MKDQYSSNPQSKPNFEKKVFEISCLSLAGVMVYGITEILLFFGYHSIINIEASIAFFSLIFFYLSRYKNLFNQVRYPFIVFLLSLSTYFWVKAEGESTPIAVGVVGILIIFIIIMPDKLKVFSLAVSLTYLFLISLFQHLFQEPKEFFYGVSIISYAVIGSVIVLLIWLLKKSYVEESNLVSIQNEKLEQINAEFHKNLIEKDEIITELRSTRDQLIESEKLASIGKLTAGLAHELNNPLNYIGGIVNPVKRDLEDLKLLIDPSREKESELIFEEVDTLLNNVTIGTRKASAIIENLVKLAPNSAVVSPVDFSKTDVNDVLKSALYIIKKSHPQVQYNQYLEKDINISGNPVELNQVFVNVLLNSIQAVTLPNKPVIEIRTATRDQSVIISFSDNGIGINKTDQARVFEPFFTSKNPGEGTGLGLYIAYSIIKKHSGEIKLESDPGLGTTVTLFLPRY